MSHWQELIAAAQRVCDLEQERAPGSGIRIAIGRLRTAVSNTRRRGPDQIFSAFTGVGLETGRGFVELSGPALPITLEAASAIELGLNLIAAGHAAESHAAFIAELQHIGVEPAQYAALLAAVRRRRNQE